MLTKMATELLKQKTRTIIYPNFKMNEKTKNVLEKIILGAEIILTVAASFAAFGYSLVKFHGYTPAKNQEFYDAEALERIKNLYVVNKE